MFGSPHPNTHNDPRRSSQSSDVNRWTPVTDTQGLPYRGKSADATPLITAASVEQEPRAEQGTRLEALPLLAGAERLVSAFGGVPTEPTDVGGPSPPTTTPHVRYPPAPIGGTRQ